MAFAFTDLTPEGKRYLAELKKLVELEVHVGFQRGEAEYEDQGGSSADVVDVAAYNELGTSDTPARPFMRQSFENHQPELQKACDRVNTVLAKGGTAETALKELGAFAKGLVQEEIVDGDFEPNKPSTIKKKGSAQPLIDSGLMRQSVNFVIKKR